MSNKQFGAFTLTVQENGIGHIVIDVVEDTMNTLKAQFVEQITELLAEVKANQSIAGLVISSGKKDSFVAGADISMIDQCQTAAEATALSRQGQMIFDQLEQLNIPVVAAIHGPCLGGGLELAMACHQRVCTDSPKTVLGLPEVQLGLLPGGGGTQRLPKLVGIQKALDMMLTGKQLRAKQALKSGLVDDVVPESILLATAEKMALSGKKSSKKQRATLAQKLLEHNPIGRSVLFSQAEKTVLAKTKGNYPAPLKIIDCVRTGVEQAPAKGYQVEANHFGALAITAESKALRQLFFATTEMKKEQGVAGVTPEAVNKIGVLGGGLMGGGIAYVSAIKAKLPVRIKDISHQGISNALRTSYNNLSRQVERGFMRKTQMQSQLARITGTTDYSGFADVDMVIEAVFEDLELKQQMVADVEQHCKSSVIFASNTSSLPIGQIAAKAKRPEQVIGLHYFSPVDKMPLVEIIPHAKTSDQTISTTVALAKKQGKTPIVVKDCAGFFVNRILAPYMNEAANLLLAGEPIDKIDRALVNYGFPVGPLQLLDEVGIDVGSKIGPILERELGERFAPPAAFERLIADKRLGKKVGKGFYQYQQPQGLMDKLSALVKRSSGKAVDESVYSLLDIVPQGRLAPTEIAERCVYQLLNEAMRCLDEGIIRNTRDGDIGAIFGIGFPPFLGGPYRLIDQIGAQHIVAKLTQWQQQFGDRFAPSEALVKLAESGNKLYSER